MAAGNASPKPAAPKATGKKAAAKRPGILDPLELAAQEVAMNTIVSLIVPRLATRKPSTIARVIARLESIAQSPGKCSAPLAKHVLHSPEDSVVGKAKPKSKKGSSSESGKGKTAKGAADEPTTAAPARIAEVSPQVVGAIVAELEKRGLSRDGRLTIGRRPVNTTSAVHLLMDVLAYPAAGDAAGYQRRINGRGGVFFELLMAFRNEVIEAELGIARENIAPLVREQMRARGMSSPQEIDAAIAAAREAVNQRFGALAAMTTDVVDSVGGSSPDVGWIENGPVTPGVFMVRFTNMRDVNGRLVADHLRAFVSFSKSGAVEIVPIGIGESKFKSGANLIVPQLLKTFERIGTYVRPAEVPVSSDITVRWGSSVAAILQSERPVPEQPLARIEGDARDASGVTTLNVKSVSTVDVAGAGDVRAVVDAVMDFAKSQAAKAK